MSTYFLASTSNIVTVLFHKNFNPFTLDKSHFISMHLILVELLEVLQLKKVQVNSQYHLQTNS